MEKDKFSVDESLMNEDINKAIESHKFPEIVEIEEFMNKFQ